MTHDSNVSPVGWYVATYVLRFIELGADGNDDPERRFLTWENTILVKADDIGQAYDKTVAFAREGTQPYKGGPDAVDAEWVFEGVTELLPVYEDLGDGAEIMWAERPGRKLRNIRAAIRRKQELLRR